MSLTSPVPRTRVISFHLHWRIAIETSASCRIIIRFWNYWIVMLWSCDSLNIHVRLSFNPRNRIYLRNFLVYLSDRYRYLFSRTVLFFCILVCFAFLLLLSHINTACWTFQWSVTTNTKADMTRITNDIKNYIKLNKRFYDLFYCVIRVRKMKYIRFSFENWFKLVFIVITSS